jgi:hypothetical protein
MNVLVLIKEWTLVNYRYAHFRPTLIFISSLYCPIFESMGRTSWELNGERASLAQHKCPYTMAVFLGEDVLEERFCWDCPLVLLIG